MADEKVSRDSAVYWFLVVLEVVYGVDGAFKSEL